MSFDRFKCSNRMVVLFARLIRSQKLYDGCSLALPVALASIFLLIFVSGCDSDRVKKLEKQDEDLKEQIEKRDTVLDYNLHAKCAKDASLWFGRNFSRNRDTMLLDYSNHYNKAMNKCFISVRHFTNTREVWHNAGTLWDVYENLQYGAFLEARSIPQSSTDECEVAGKKCKNIDEWNELAWSYMNG